MAKSYSVTSAGVNPAQDRAHRMRMYFIAMSLRVVCVTSLFWVRGWWVLLAAAGAVLLPWFAVMVGNAVAHGGEEEHETPDPLQIHAGVSDAADEAPAADTLLVVDVEPARRAERGSCADSVGSETTAHETPGTAPAVVIETGSGPDEEGRCV